MTENKIFSFISADLIRARINFFFCYWFPKGRRWISSSGISCRDFTADQNALSPPTVFIFLPASNAPCAAAAGTRVAFFFFPMEFRLPGTFFQVVPVAPQNVAEREPIAVQWAPLLSVSRIPPPYFRCCTDLLLRFTYFYDFFFRDFHPIRFDLIPPINVTALQWIFSVYIQV